MMMLLQDDETLLGLVIESREKGQVTFSFLFYGSSKAPIQQVTNGLNLMQTSILTRLFHGTVYLMPQPHPDIRGSWSLLVGPENRLMKTFNNLGAIRKIFDRSPPNNLQKFILIREAALGSVERLPDFPCFLVNFPIKYINYLMAYTVGEIELDDLCVGSRRLSRNLDAIMAIAFGPVLQPESRIEPYVGVNFFWDPHNPQCQEDGFLTTLKESLACLYGRHAFVTKHLTFSVTHSLKAKVLVEFIKDQVRLASFDVNSPSDLILLYPSK